MRALSSSCWVIGLTLHLKFLNLRRIYKTGWSHVFSKLPRSFVYWSELIWKLVDVSRKEATARLVVTHLVVRLILSSPHSSFNFHLHQQPVLPRFSFHFDNSCFFIFVEMQTKLLIVNNFGSFGEIQILKLHKLLVFLVIHTKTHFRMNIGSTFHILLITAFYIILFSFDFMTILLKLNFS